MENVHIIYDLGGSLEFLFYLVVCFVVLDFFFFFTGYLLASFLLPACICPALYSLKSYHAS